MEIWDRGDYVLLERSLQAIKIDFQGKKLTGNYALVFFKEERGQRQWLLFKLAKQSGKRS